MRRTLAFVLASLTLVGFVVAMLPAQDPVPWKRPGSMRTPRQTDVAPAGGEGPSEPAQFPMDAADSLHAAAADEESNANNVRQAQLRRRAGFQERGQLPEVPAAPSAAAPAEESAQHSVLKRAPGEQGSVASPHVDNPAEERGVLAPPSGAASSRRTGRPTPMGRSPSAPPTVPSRVTDVQVASRMPSLRMELAGPGSIQVGKPARYTIYANNEGDVAAQDVVLQLPLPSAVNLTKGESSAGEAEVQADESGALVLVWTVPTLAARGRETLQMELLASDGAAFELTFSWTSKPAAATAKVAVKEPQLAVSLSGPADMLYGEEKTFTVVVSNPGTGDASGVEVDITTGATKPQRVEVGTVPAGEQVEIPVQVLANQAGELEIKAVAKGEGDLSADAAGKVLVRSAELAVLMDGPQLKFAGSDATYVVVVANRGNAPADATLLAVRLPDDARYLGGVDNAAASKGTVRWNVGVIPPGAEKSYEIRCQLLTEGPNQLVARAEAKHGIAAEAGTVTQVEAVAELKLVVNDPSGPSPVGSEVVYEVQVMNRGSRSASDVKVLMQFGQGVEPSGLVGGKGKMVPGQVIFEPIPQLDAGEQVTVKVKAKAEKAGTHQFRVEVTMGDDGTRLVSEGTNRFFAERSAAEPATPAAANTAAKPQIPTPARVRQR